MRIRTGYGIRKTQGYSVMLNILYLYDTVEVMIMSRYRYRPVTITDRDRSLPNFTVTCVTSITDRNIVCFGHIFNVLFKKLM